MIPEMRFMWIIDFDTKNKKIQNNLLIKLKSSCHICQSFGIIGNQFYQTYMTNALEDDVTS